MMMITISLEISLSFSVFAQSHDKMSFLHFFENEEGKKDIAVTKIASRLFLH